MLGDLYGPWTKSQKSTIFGQKFSLKCHETKIHLYRGENEFLKISLPTFGQIIPSTGFYEQFSNFGKIHVLNPYTKVSVEMEVKAASLDDAIKKSVIQNEMITMDYPAQTTFINEYT